MTSRMSRSSAMFGIDFHIASTLLLRCWSIIAGAVMIFAIPATLDPQRQGYYFTFSSLLALQIFFELGLNQVVAQMVSHEMAHLKIDASGQAVDDDFHLHRIQSIVLLLRKWYSAAAILFAIVAVTAGCFLFGSSGTLPAQVWAGPWTVLVLLSAANLFMSPFLAMLEGCGHVGQVASVRLVQSMTGYGLAWIALFYGAGLWAIPLIAGAATVGTAVWLRRDAPPLRMFVISTPIPRSHGIDWRREVFPFQWKIALSWVSGYLMFQLLTPLTFAHLGPVHAGRLGMSLAIFNALQSVGLSWVNAKIPAMTAMASRNERRELDRTFTSVLTRSAAFTAIASLGVLSAVQLLTMGSVRVVDRIADVSTLTCIAAVSVANAIVYAAASYLRAYRSEPMLPMSVTVAMLTLLGAWYGSHYGIFLTMLPQTIATIAIALPWTLALVRAYRRRNLV